jgi:predicted amidohydrolase YtcJ
LSDFRTTSLPRCTYAAFEENDKGTIEVGKLADFTVLSADIMKVPPPDILKSPCAMTVIGDEIVFGAQ